MDHDMSSFLSSVRYSLPSNWENQSREKMELVELDKNSSEYEDIVAIMGIITPTRICRVENPYLWGMYQLKKEECVVRNIDTVEEELWHVTSPDFIDSIATDNFDWRRAIRVKYGQGVCFSPILNHSLIYSTYTGAAILAKVLVGHETNDANYKTTIPNGSCDTTTGSGGNVYVKYMDNEFYPEYVAYL